MDEELEAITGMNGDATYIREHLSEHVDIVYGLNYPGDIAQALEELAEPWRGIEDEYAQELIDKEET